MESKKHQWKNEKVGHTSALDFAAQVNARLASRLCADDEDQLALHDLQASAHTKCTFPVP